MNKPKKLAKYRQNKTIKYIFEFKSRAYLLESAEANPKHIVNT